MVDEMGGPRGALPNSIKQKPIYKKKTKEEEYKKENNNKN
jgi:hypothetical protein